MLILNEENFLGQGTHKKTYYLVDEPDKCIKVAYSKEGSVDLMREIDYRARRDKNGLKSRMLPACYGKRSTNKGEGYVFELVKDYDGKPTKTFEYYIADQELFKENFEMLVEVLATFKKLLMEERLLTMGIFPENILVQRVDDEVKIPRLINDMGCANFIRLEYYFDHFAKKKIERRWGRFCDTLNNMYPSSYMDELIKRVGKKY